MFSFKVYKTAFKSLIRNRWLTFATVILMTFTLLIVSIFIVLNILVNSAVETTKARIDMEVYFKNEVTEDNILEIKKDLLNMPEVEEVTYISKEEALKIFKERESSDPSIAESITAEDNPLPASLKIKTKRTEDLEMINSLFIGGKYSEITDGSTYEKNKDTVKKFITLGNYIREGGIALSIIFILTSLIVVLNTIRMTLYSRKEEIEIMRLVGATNWYIRWPFILEGAFYGFISMIFASVILIAGLKLSEPSVTRFLAGGFSEGFYNSLSASGLTILGYQFAISIFVGVVSSTIAIGRYLKI